MFRTAMLIFAALIISGSARAECLLRPVLSDHAGYWKYHIDRSTHQHCWYQVGRHSSSKLQAVPVIKPAVTQQAPEPKPEPPKEPKPVPVNNWRTKMADADAPRVIKTTLEQPWQFRSVVEKTVSEPVLSNRIADSFAVFPGQAHAPEIPAAVSHVGPIVTAAAVDVPIESAHWRVIISGLRPWAYVILMAWLYFMVWYFEDSFVEGSLQIWVKDRTRSMWITLCGAATTTVRIARYLRSGVLAPRLSLMANMSWPSIR